jgi:hypothetical protein
MWLSRNSNRWNRGRDLSPVVLRAAADFILEREARAAGKGSPGCLVGDKSPNSLLDGEAVRNLAKVYPDARLIFIVRDGRDAAVSHRFQAFIDRPHHLSPESRQIRAAYIRDPEPFLHGEESLFPTRELRQAAEGWAHNVEETNLTGRDLLGERYFSLRYEDLIARTHEEMLRLWDFLGVEIDSSALKKSLDTELGRNPDADWQQEKAAEIAGSMRKGERGTWRELFTAHDREIFKKAAGDTLIAWRYENDLNW